MVQNASVFTFWLVNALGATAACHFLAIFRHPHFKKWAGPLMFFTFWLANVLRATAAFQFSTPKLPKILRAEVFCTFWLANVLLATAACHFWTCGLPKVLRQRVFLAFWRANVLRAAAACHFSCLLWAATSAPAALASLLFDPADAQIIEKTQHFVTSLTFRAGGSSFYWLSRNCIFFLLILLLFSAFHLLTLLLCSAFQLSILSEVRLLNFLWLYYTYMFSGMVTYSNHQSTIRSIWHWSEDLAMPLPRPGDLEYKKLLNLHKSTKRSDIPDIIHLCQSQYSLKKLSLQE